MCVYLEWSARDCQLTPEKLEAHYIPSGNYIQVAAAPLSPSLIASNSDGGQEIEDKLQETEQKLLMMKEMKGKLLDVYQTYHAAEMATKFSNLRKSSNVRKVVILNIAALIQVSHTTQPPFLQ